MAKANLPVNFKDDILKENMNGKRRFNMIQNSDGTVSFEDVTDYTQVGSTFGAAQINATNKAVNNAADASKIIDSLETIKANTQSGYIAGALAVKALNSNLGKTSFARFATTNQVYNENSPSGIIPFNNNNFDETDFTLSPDSTAITVEQSGTYTLDIHINGGNRTTTCLMVNGNIKLGDNSYSSNAGPFTQSYSGILNLNKGDKISIYYRGTSWGGSNQGFVAGSWFSIGKLKK